jgi:light-regulated signal transduction histidine kinase (bacteriophytochrome)
MDQLINDLLQLSRTTRGKIAFSMVDMSSLGNHIARDLQASQPNREVRFSISPDMNAYADERLLRVVLENILGNAWKFTSKKENASIEFSQTRVDDQSVFYIRDNGAGFDMKYADQLFNVFQRLHRDSEFEGTGIGLATVQRIIHRHGGKIWAEAKVNQGATFYFTVQDKSDTRD